MLGLLGLLVLVTWQGNGMDLDVPVKIPRIGSRPRLRRYVLGDITVAVGS